MSEIKLPLATTTWDEKELEAMKKVIDGGRFTMGEQVAHYQSGFASFHNRKYAVMCNSGSSGNLLMVASFL